MANLHSGRTLKLISLSAIVGLAMGRLRDNRNDLTRRRSPSAPTTRAPAQPVEVNVTAPTTAPIPFTPKPNNPPRAPTIPKPRGPTLAPVAPCAQLTIDSCSTDVNDLTAKGPCPCGSPIYQVNLVITALAPTAMFALLEGFGEAKNLVIFSPGTNVGSTELEDSGTPLPITCGADNEVSVGLTDSFGFLVCTQTFSFPFGP